MLDSVEYLGQNKSEKKNRKRNSLHSSATQSSIFALFRSMFIIYFGLTYVNIVQ